MFVIPNAAYKSQLDNANNPTGSCNVTSMIMAMCTGGLPRTIPNGKQTEDALYEFLIQQGYSRHAPYDLSRGANEFRKRFFPELEIWSELDVNARWSKIKTHLDKNRPVVIHGYFTGFGHIVCIVGYDGSNWIVNDPYGEWNSWGYNCNVSGEQLKYSHNLMEGVCGPDGTMWAHFIDWKTAEPNPFIQIPGRYRGNQGGLKLQQIYVENLSLEINQIGQYASWTWQIQVRLNSLKLDAGVTDSIWGPKTESAFKLFCERIKAGTTALNKTVAEKLIELQSL